jgi:predicted ATPase
MSKRTYESIATIAEALPDHKREEFAALLEDLQRNMIHPDSTRRVAIRRWLADAGWTVTR